MSTGRPIPMAPGHAVGDAEVASPSRDMQDNIFLDGIDDHFALTVSCMVDPLSGSAPEDRVGTQPDAGSTCSLGYRPVGIADIEACTGIADGLSSLLHGGAGAVSELSCEERSNAASRMPSAYQLASLHTRLRTCLQVAQPRGRPYPAAMMVRGLLRPAGSKRLYCLSGLAELSSSRVDSTVGSTVSVVSTSARLLAPLSARLSALPSALRWCYRQLDCRLCRQLDDRL